MLHHFKWIFRFIFCLPICCVIVASSVTQPVLAQHPVTYSLEGDITHIEDGDTLTLHTKEGEKVIRLSDIDAPEVYHPAQFEASCHCIIEPEKLGQPYGKKAKQALEKLAPRHARARAVCYEKDKFERHVCEVYVNQSNIGLEMLAQGWATVFKNSQWVRNAQSLSTLKIAQAKKRGMWETQDTSYLTPAQWRHWCWQASASHAACLLGEK